MRTARLLCTHMKTMVAQITTLYNHNEQKSISNHNISNLEADGQQKTTSGTTLASQEQESEVTVGNWTVKDWEHVAWSFANLQLSSFNDSGQMWVKIPGH